MQLYMYENGIFTLILGIIGTCLWLLPSTIGALLCFLGIVLTLVLFLFWLKIEFFAAIILLIYAGAIVVLLLFIIMCMDFIDVSVTSRSKDTYYRRNLMVGLLFCLLLQKSGLEMLHKKIACILHENHRAQVYKAAEIVEIFTNYKIANVTSLAQLYTEYADLLIFVGLGLLMAMLCAIYLTYRAPKH